MIDERRLLRQMFDAAVASAQPLHLIPRHLPPLCYLRAGMAQTPHDRKAHAAPKLCL